MVAFERLELALLKSYHRKEGPGRSFEDWFEDNREFLVNPLGKVYRPVHPSRDCMTRSVSYSKECVMRALRDVLAGAFDFEAYSAIAKDAVKRKDAGSYTLQSRISGSVELFVWNPDGQLIYELWMNKKI